MAMLQRIKTRRIYSKELFSLPPSRSSANIFRREGIPRNRRVKTPMVPSAIGKSLMCQPRKYIKAEANIQLKAKLDAMLKTIESRAQRDSQQKTLIVSGQKAKENRRKTRKVTPHSARLPINDSKTNTDVAATTMGARDKREPVFDDDFSDVTSMVVFPLSVMTALSVVH